MEKILITGTGRCGTTFLIKLFSFLEYDTGFTKENYKKYIFKNCNAGMEKNINADHYILKNPEFIKNIDTIIQEHNIKKIIIPIRDYKLSAASRLVNKFNAGGFWNARYEKEQIAFYNKIMADYLFYMTKYNIPTIFLDFDKMVNDKKYLFDNFKDILAEKNINFDFFSSIYDEVSNTSKPMKQ